MLEEEFKFKKPGEVRVRMAPSPTGSLHIGTARTTLFNYLFAKQNEGSFVLRIEDTDLERSDPAFEKDIIENLKWLGLHWSEGPDVDGEYGPYRQTERTESYKKYIKKLLKEDKAYHCFCSEEELEAKRQYKMSMGEAPIYSGKCATIPKKTAEKYIAEGKKSIIRFRVQQKKISFEDMIKGKVEFDCSLIGDISIAKDINTPLYNFAVVIDDEEMKISHVIRGEDHLSNTPKQILIQEALGFERPIYAHLPLILGPDKTKLSKRHGNFSIIEFKKQGYLPEALINFIAFFGWNPGDEREIYSLPSLVKEFSLENVQKSGAIFNAKRLDFLNGFYIRQKSNEKLTELCLPYLIEANLIEKIINGHANPGSSEETEKIGIFEEEKPEYRIKETGEGISFENLVKIISLYKERLKKLSEIAELTDFFFKENLIYEKDLLNWRHTDTKETRTNIDKLDKILYKIDGGSWNKKTLETIILAEAEKIGDRGKLLWPLRVAMTGKEASAGPFEIAEIMGKENTLKRIKKALEITEK